MSAMKYFSKPNPTVAFMLSSGQRVTFERVQENLGVIQTNNPAIYSDLVQAIERGVGGVVQITGDEYAALKKNTFSESWREEIGAGGRYERNHQPVRAMAGQAVVPAGSPISVPTVAGTPAAPEAKLAEAPVPSGTRPVTRRQKGKK